jgi:hypothetical protein
VDIVKTKIWQFFQATSSPTILGGLFLSERIHDTTINRAVQGFPFSIYNNGLIITMRRILLNRDLRNLLVKILMSKADKNKNEQPNKDELRSTANYSVPICGPGTQIGQFRIEQEIGRGGMGVVYLAHDSKLDRQVAIKSIPPALAENHQIKSRFQREAKLLASLDHPDIATIYDIIEGDQGIG